MPCEMADPSEYGDVYAVDFSYPFLSGIDPAKPPSTIDIPARYLDAMGNMERQYWEIKCKQYNSLIFFKKGKFYELYDYDAVIATKEFGLKMVFDTTNRGKMRLAGVPEQSYSEWARLFVFRGYKVGRVEQLKEGEDKGNSPVKAKIVARGLVEVVTPGTLTDPAMLSDHNEVFILSIVPVPEKGIIDVFAADLSRRVLYWCPCGYMGSVHELWRQGGVTASGGAPNNAASQGDSVMMDMALHCLSSLLQQLHPKEIIVPGTTDGGGGDGNTIPSLVKWIEGEGFTVECLPSSIANEGLGDHEAEMGANKVSAAGQLLAQYFRNLRLEREIPLLAEASTYSTHLQTDGGGLNPSTTSAAVRANPVMSVSLLALERKHDMGLVLDANTVSNLEIISNLRDGSSQHSINYCLNQCTTNGGKRMFRSWLLRPSAEAAVIQARQDAVRFLADQQLSSEWAAEQENDPGTQESAESASSHSSLIGRKRPRSSSSLGQSFEARFASLLGVDLERSLSRLADMKADNSNIAYVDPLVQYKKNLGHILTSVQAFVEMVDWAQQFRKRCESTPQSIPLLLAEIISSIEAAAKSTEQIEKLFDREVAASSGLLIPAAGTCPEYDEAVADIVHLEGTLHAERKRAQTELFQGATVGFTDLGKDLFLFEVVTSSAPKMTPRGLVERARSNKSVKYVVQALEGTVEAYKQATARKSAALLTVLRSVASRICEQCPILYTASNALAYFDCLMNLNRLRSRYTQWCFPTIVGSKGGRTNGSIDRESGDDCGGAFLSGVDLLHPLLASSNPVPNTIHLDTAHGRVLVLTGPNMAGKSTLMRTVAVNLLLAQVGGPVLGSAMSVCPVTRIFTRIGARDASHKGHSTLFVELSETASILRSADSRSLCLIDELGRGTSTHDGMAIAHATLTALSRVKPLAPLVVFSTHYHALALEQERCGKVSSTTADAPGESGLGTPGQVQLGYMDFTLGSALTHRADGLPGGQGDAAGGVPPIIFLYRLVPGICARSYGVEVALMAGVPPHLVQVAKEKSLELTQRTALHEDREAVSAFLQAEARVSVDA